MTDDVAFHFARQRTGIIGRCQEAVGPINDAQGVPGEQVDLCCFENAKLCAALLNRYQGNIRRRRSLWNPSSTLFSFSVQTSTPATTGYLPGLQRSNSR